MEQRRHRSDQRSRTSPNYVQKSSALNAEQERDIRRSVRESAHADSFSSKLFKNSPQKFSEDEDSEENYKTNIFSSPKTSCRNDFQEKANSPKFPHSPPSYPTKAESSHRKGLKKREDSEYKGPDILEQMRARVRQASTLEEDQEENWSCVIQDIPNNTKNGYDWMKEAETDQSEFKSPAFENLAAKEQERLEKKTRLKQAIKALVEEENRTRHEIVEGSFEDLQTVRLCAETQKKNIENQGLLRKQNKLRTQDLLKRAKEEKEWTTQERQRQEMEKQERERKIMEQKKAEMEKLKRSNLERAELEKNQGNKMYKEGRYIEAIAYYTKAINFEPLVAYYTNRAAAHLMLANHSSCIEDCTTALQKDSKYVKALIRRGKCYVQMDRWEDAVRDLELALKYENNTENLSELDDCWRKRCEQFEVSRPKIRDHYKVLCLKPSADVREVKKAFHKLALQWHPDRHQEALCDNQIRFAEIIFKEVSEANTVLTDPKKKEIWEKEFEEYTRLASIPVVNGIRTPPLRPQYPTNLPVNVPPPNTSASKANRSSCAPMNQQNSSTGSRSFSNTTFIPNGAPPCTYHAYVSNDRTQPTSANRQRAGSGGVAEAYGMHPSKASVGKSMKTQSARSITPPRSNNVPLSRNSSAHVLHPTTSVTRHGSVTKGPPSYF